VYACVCVCVCVCVCACVCVCVCLRTSDDDDDDDDDEIDDGDDGSSWTMRAISCRAARASKSFGNVMSAAVLGRLANSAST
jgi:hypothetical protein